MFRLNFISSRKHAAAIAQIARELLDVFMEPQYDTLEVKENFVAVLSVGAQAVNLVTTLQNAVDSTVSDDARKQPVTYVNHLLDRVKTWLTRTLSSFLREHDYEAVRTETKVTIVRLLKAI